MKELRLIERVVLEIKDAEVEEATPNYVAGVLRRVADMIEAGKKGDAYMPDLGVEVLWEHESKMYGGFPMGNRSLISDAYYGAKQYYEVCSLSKEDIEQQGFDASKLTAEDMQRIASKQGDLICDCCDYWTALDGACEYWDVPRKNDDDVREVIPGTMGLLNELSL